MLKNRYKVYKPKDSNGYVYVIDTRDSSEVCTCYYKGLKKAKCIVKALNLLNRKESKNEFNISEHRRP